MTRYALSFEADYLLEADLGDEPTEAELGQAVQNDLGTFGVAVGEIVTWSKLDD